MNGAERHEIFVTRTSIQIPPDPGPADQFPVDDARHWYADEYAPWIVPRLPSPPRQSSGSSGSRKWHIRCLGPGTHPYFSSYVERMELDAVEAGVHIDVRQADWDAEYHLEQVREAVRDKPDFVIYVAHHSDIAALALSMLHEAGIPTLGSNMPLSPEAIRYVVGWTGPDSWAQSRALARRFALSMGSSGGYVIIGHLKGTSVNLARTYGVLTELREFAPRMTCLEHIDGQFDVDATLEVVRSLLREYGPKLRGIVSADDNVLQRGIDRALAEAERFDVKRVAHGSTAVGMSKLADGKLEAITYQSARADGALALQAALDWLSGLEIEPARFLPVHVIDAGNYSDFNDRLDTLDSLTLAPLTDAVIDCSEREVRHFFDTLLTQIESTKVVWAEAIQAIALEVFVNLASITHDGDIDVSEVFGSYEKAYKNLVKHSTVADVLDWLQTVSVNLVRARVGRQTHAGSLVERLVATVDQRYREPISLKVLAAEFGVSAPYLGRIYRSKTGASFSTAINEKRVEKAKELLRLRSIPAKSIAQQLGFNDPNYFYLVFKRVTGMTVTEFLQQSGSGAVE
jgi:ABC-type sugar transport system substrate-binding protein/AraC-like DNA-binding protein